MTAGAMFWAGLASSVCACSTASKQPAHVALEQIRCQAGFLGGAFDKAAALAVPAQVHLVEVEAFARPQTQGDFQGVGADGLFQTGHPVFPAFQVEVPGVVARLQAG